IVAFAQHLPEYVPGWGHLGQRRGQFAALQERLREAAPVVAVDLAASLQECELPRETMTEAGLEFIRRRVGEEVYYFIANQTAESYDGWLALARPVTAATLFDPMTGESGQLAVRHGNHRTKIYLQIAPGESRIVRLSPIPVSSGKPWTSLVPSGKPLLLDQPWQVEFVQGEPAHPASYQIARLASWTEAPDQEAQRFAGTACYKTNFDLPESAQADDWLLDLGEVRESARVRINGQEAGVLIALPMRLRIGQYVHPGKNTLAIEVTNLSANRLRDLARRGTDWKIMKDINIVTVHYQKIEPANWPLEPSGLLGPVRLLPMAKLEHDAQ
ncbi:MAG: glycosylhydrolase-like jelly roll fold domain-containing protein, partial [Pirellulales bacterium]